MDAENEGKVLVDSGVAYCLRHHGITTDEDRCDFVDDDSEVDEETGEPLDCIFTSMFYWADGPEA